MTIPRQSIARCTYYNMSVTDIERGIVPLKCERMNIYGECPPSCAHYTVFPTARTEVPVHVR